MHASDFGNDFTWGVSSSAYQVEGAYNEDGKGLSIWDAFTGMPKKIYAGHTGKTACNFYHRFMQDIILMQFLNIEHFRFSLSWSRLFPNGTGIVNEKGVEYYDQLINFCLECGIEPWITLYHWDLPQALEEKGGWTNRDIVNWFEAYVSFCLKRFGDRVKNWMVLNEPVVFTGAGYFLGQHAPGKKGLANYLPAVHHAALCQALGGRLIKSFNSNLQAGTTYSCAQVDPIDDSKQSIEAAQKVDVITNRLFIEPLLGDGYPWHDLKVLQQLEKYMRNGDEQMLRFDMDFIGLQHYTREVVQYSSLMPYLHAKLVKASQRGVERTALDWEVYPEGIYNMLKRFDNYHGIKKLMITENGAAFNDRLENGHVHDPQRIQYFQRYLAQVLKAKQEGLKVGGYFAWSFTDNFEWAEGYGKRFGLVYVDYATQKRIVKDSGFWYRDFLEKSEAQTCLKAV